MKRCMGKCLACTEVNNLTEEMKRYLETFFCYSRTFSFLRVAYANIAPEFSEILCSSVLIHRVFSLFL